MMKPRPFSKRYLTTLGRDGALEVGTAVIAAAKAAGAELSEVVIMTEDSGLTRYSANHIHQSVAETNAEIRLRVALGKRVAVISANQFGLEGIADLARRAVQMAKANPEDPYFGGLPHAQIDSYPDLSTFIPETAEVDSSDRAGAVRDIVELVRGAGATAYGAVSTGVNELLVMNSNGVTAYSSFTDAWLSVIARRSQNGVISSGYATECNRDWRELDTEAASLRALSKAASSSPRRLAPGSYRAVLEEPAVADILGFLAFSALNGLEVVEGRSLYTGRIGQTIYPKWITLVDDPIDPCAAVTPFDFEGVVKRRVPLIEAGRLTEVAWDTSTARRAGRESNGFALPAPNTWGPMPYNLALVPGGESRAELLAEIERGLLVTRFHYVNMVDPAKTLLTGMTRDGTFLVEDGEVVGPVQDLRWLDSVDGLLKRTLAVGDAPRLISEGPGYGMRFLQGSLVPPILVDEFNVIGSAQE